MKQCMMADWTDSMYVSGINGRDWLLGLSSLSLVAEPRKVENSNQPKKPDSVTKGFLECHFSQYSSPQIISLTRCHQTIVKKIRNACLSWSLPRWLWYHRRYCSHSGQNALHLAFGRQETWLPWRTQESSGNCLQVTTATKKPPRAGKIHDRRIFCVQSVFCTSVLFGHF